MTVYGAVWALNLVEVTPLAKLVAIRLGDDCDADGRGTIDLGGLAEWCCASVVDVEAALSLLDDLADVRWASLEANVIRFNLPYQARVSGMPSRQVIEGKLTLYVMTGPVGVKVGITSQLERRVAGLRLALLTDSINCVWSTEAAESVIRRAERLAHSALAANLYRNEWFTCTPQEAIDSCIKAVDEAKRLLSG